MLHAPTAESKKGRGASRTVAARKPQDELHLSCSGRGGFAAESPGFGLQRTRDCTNSRPVKVASSHRNLAFHLKS
jgi:hypothetical protein